MTKPNYLLGVYGSLPAEEQNKIMKELHQALLWKGWDRRKPNHASEHIANIAYVLLNNGIEVEEYC